MLENWHDTDCGICSEHRDDDELVTVTIITNSSTYKYENVVKEGAYRFFGQVKNAKPEDRVYLETMCVSHLFTSYEVRQVIITDE
jgi:hypothetical protein